MIPIFSAALRLTLLSLFLSWLISSGGAFCLAGVLVAQEALVAQGVPVVQEVPVAQGVP